MIRFVVKRVDGTKLEWRQVRPGDERFLCRLFARWPADPGRPTLGSWPAGAVLTYADCFAGVSAQLDADGGLDYTAALGDAAETRVLVRPGFAACILTSGRLVLASTAENPFLDAVDMQAYLYALGVRDLVDTFVGDGGTESWESTVRLKDWQDAFPAWGLVDV